MKSRDISNVYVAHSKSRNPLETIEEFCRSDGGVLVAVDVVEIVFDDPTLDALVIARPLKSYLPCVQMRGRVLRWCSNRPKTRSGALILHLAAEYVMGNDKMIKTG